MTSTLSALPGFRDLDIGVDGPLVQLGVGAIDATETAHVFVGIPADALPEAAADDWSQAYRDYLGRADVFVDGNDVAADSWYGWYGGPL